MFSLSQLKKKYTKCCLRCTCRWTSGTHTVSMFIQRWEFYKYYIIRIFYMKTHIVLIGYCIELIWAPGLLDTKRLKTLYLSLFPSWNCCDIWHNTQLPFIIKRLRSIYIQSIKCMLLSKYNNILLWWDMLWDIFL